MFEKPIWTMRRCVFSLTVALALPGLLSCTARAPLSLRTADSVDVGVQYTLPSARIDPDIRNALANLLGKPGAAREVVSAAEQSAQTKAASPSFTIKVVSASLEYIPFIYDRNSQNQEYLGEVRFHTQLWHGAELIKDWTEKRQHSLSVNAREHYRDQRLQEFRAELAEWAVLEWFQELRWIVNNYSLYPNEGDSTPP